MIRKLYTFLAVAALMLSSCKKGEKVAVREFRGLAPHYLRGTSGAAKLRGAISQANTLAEIETLLQLEKA